MARIASHLIWILLPVLEVSTCLAQGTLPDGRASDPAGLTSASELALARLHETPPREAVEALLDRVVRDFPPGARHGQELTPFSEHTQRTEAGDEGRGEEASARRRATTTPPGYLPDGRPIGSDADRNRSELERIEGLLSKAEDPRERALLLEMAVSAARDGAEARRALSLLEAAAEQGREGAVSILQSIVGLAGRTGDTGAARRAFARLRARPDGGDAWRACREVYLELVASSGEGQEEIAECERLLGCTKDAPLERRLVLDLLVLRAREETDPGELLERIQRFLRESPEDEAIHRSLAIVALAPGRRTSILDLYEGLIGTEPAGARTWAARGLAIALDSRDEAAIGTWTERLRPLVSPPARIDLWLADVLVSRGESAGAAAALGRAAEQVEDSERRAAITLYRGYLLDLSGDLDGASALWEGISSIDSKVYLRAAAAELVYLSYRRTGRQAEFFDRYLSRERKRRE